MIRVIHRLEAADLSQEALARSWREAMSAICAKGKGALGGALLRSAEDPSGYLVVTRWESVEAWRAFWSKGPSEPQGDPAHNEIFTEIDVFEATHEGPNGNGMAMTEVVAPDLTPAPPGRGRRRNRKRAPSHSSDVREDERRSQ